MSIYDRIRLLEYHCIPTKEENGRLFALSSSLVGQEWIDVTEWNRSRLLIWLGY